MTTNLTAIVVVSVACLLPGQTQDSAELPDVHQQIAEERAKLPGMVFDLFYAVKDSLDYGVVEDERSPEAKLRDYRRVTPKLMETFEVEWKVELYRAFENDYELIISSRADESLRFKATRTRRYEWDGEVWRDLGGYLYF